jgi:hypothetical protein
MSLEEDAVDDKTLGWGGTTTSSGDGGKRGGGTVGSNGNFSFSSPSPPTSINELIRYVLSEAWQIVDRFRCHRHLDRVQQDKHEGENRPSLKTVGSTFDRA